MTAICKMECLFLLLLFVIRNVGVLGFTGVAYQHPSTAKAAVVERSTLTRLYQSAVEVKFLDREKESMGPIAREWPQHVKTGVWTERVDDGVLAARYILGGSGTIDVTLYGPDGRTPKTAAPTTHKLVPGALVEAMGPATIDWDAGDSEMVVLTKGNEQGSFLAASVALFVVLCGTFFSAQMGQ